jgi:hypothetical protein
MGEIKSTLDLVLEKTKDLTLSSEEKKVQKQKEVENRIKGLLQKYQDGLLSKSELKTDYEILKKDYEMSGDDVLINEIAGRLAPEQDNQPLLELMHECCSIETTEIETIIEQFRDAKLAAEKDRMEGLKELIAQQHGISGSALVPNLEKDEQWRQETRRMHAGFEDQLNRATAKLNVD